MEQKISGRENNLILDGEKFRTMSGMAEEPLGKAKDTLQA